MIKKRLMIWNTYIAQSTDSTDIEAAELGMFEPEAV